MAKKKAKTRDRDQDDEIDDRDDDRPVRKAPKAKNDAYTAMLFITLLAILIGCTMMYLDWDEYGKQNPPKEVAPALPKLGEGGPATPGN